MLIWQNKLAQAKRRLEDHLEAVITAPTEDFIMKEAYKDIEVAETGLLADKRFDVEGIPSNYAMAPAIRDVYWETEEADKFYRNIHEYLIRVAEHEPGYQTGDLVMERDITIAGFPFVALLVRIMYDISNPVNDANLTLPYIHATNLRRVVFPEYEQSQD